MSTYELTGFRFASHTDSQRGYSGNINEAYRTVTSTRNDHKTRPDQSYQTSCPGIGGTGGRSRLGTAYNNSTYIMFPNSDISYLRNLYNSSKVESVVLSWEIKTADSGNTGATTWSLKACTERFTNNNNGVNRPAADTCQATSFSLGSSYDKNKPITIDITRTFNQLLKYNSGTLEISTPNSACRRFLSAPDSIKPTFTITYMSVPDTPTIKVKQTDCQSNSYLYNKVTLQTTGAYNENVLYSFSVLSGSSVIASSPFLTNTEYTFSNLRSRIPDAETSISVIVSAKYNDSTLTATSASKQLTITTPPKFTSSITNTEKIEYNSAFILNGNLQFTATPSNVSLENSNKKRGYTPKFTYQLDGKVITGSPCTLSDNKYHTLTITRNNGFLTSSHSYKVAKAAPLSVNIVPVVNNKVYSTKIPCDTSVTLNIEAVQATGLQATINLSYKLPDAAVRNIPQQVSNNISATVVVPSFEYSIPASTPPTLNVTGTITNNLGQTLNVNHTISINRKPHFVCNSQNITRSIPDIFNNSSVEDEETTEYSNKFYLPVDSMLSIKNMQNLDNDTGDSTSYKISTNKETLTSAVNRVTLPADANLYSATLSSYDGYNFSSNSDTYSLGYAAAPISNINSAEWDILSSDTADGPYSITLRSANSVIIKPYVRIQLPATSSNLQLAGTTTSDMRIACDAVLKTSSSEQVVKTFMSNVGDVVNNTHLIDFEFNFYTSENSYIVLRCYYVDRFNQRSNPIKFTTDAGYEIEFRITRKLQVALSGSGNMYTRWLFGETSDLTSNTYNLFNPTLNVEVLNPNGAEYTLTVEVIPVNETTGELVSNNLYYQLNASNGKSRTIPSAFNSSTIYKPSVTTVWFNKVLAGDNSEYIFSEGTYFIKPVIKDSSTSEVVYEGTYSPETTIKFSGTYLKQQGTPGEWNIDKFKVDNIVEADTVNVLNEYISNLWKMYTPLSHSYTSDVIQYNTIVGANNVTASTQQNIGYNEYIAKPSRGATGLINYCEGLALNTTSYLSKFIPLQNQNMQIDVYLKCKAALPSTSFNSSAVSMEIRFYDYNLKEVGYPLVISPLVQNIMNDSTIINYSVGDVLTLTQLIKSSDTTIETGKTLLGSASYVQIFLSNAAYSDYFELSLNSGGVYYTSSEQITYNKNLFNSELNQLLLSDYLTQTLDSIRENYTLQSGSTLTLPKYINKQITNITNDKNILMDNLYRSALTLLNFIKLRIASEDPIANNYITISDADLPSAELTSTPYTYETDDKIVATSTDTLQGDTTALTITSNASDITLFNILKRF